MGKNAKGFEFRKFATPRIIGGIAIVIIILWALSIIFGTPQDPTSEDTAVRQLDSPVATAPAGSDGRSQTTLAEYPSAKDRAAKGRPAGRKATDTHAAAAGCLGSGGTARSRRYHRPRDHQQP